METRLFFLKTITNLHCGIGQGLSDIDLPTAKEAVSGHPFVPGSSIKGVLRDTLAGGDQDLLNAAFGAEGKDCVDAASSAAITDARLLCLPVRSFFGTFAWVASPYTLHVFRTLAERAGVKDIPEAPKFNPEAQKHYRCAVTKGTVLSSGNLVMLEDLDLTVENGTESAADSWAAFIAENVCATPEEAGFFAQRFVVVNDNVLNFLSETALPVQAHIRISEETGTVAPGALWYMEVVPAECLMVGMVLADKGRGKYKNLSAGKIMEFVAGGTRFCQIGGNASTGCGMVALRFAGANVGRG